MSLRVRITFASILVVVLLLIGVIFRINPALLKDRKEEIRWQTNLEATTEPAKKQNKYVLADFYTDWCHWCQVLDYKVFTKQDLVHYLNQDFICVKIKADDGAEGSTVAEGFGVHSYPRALVFSPDGIMIGQIEGYREAPEYLAALKEIVLKYQQSQENKSKDPEHPDPQDRQASGPAPDAVPAIDPRVQDVWKAEPSPGDKAAPAASTNW